MIGQELRQAVGEAELRHLLAAPPTRPRPRRCRRPDRRRRRSSPRSRAPRSGGRRRAAPSIRRAARTGRRAPSPPSPRGPTPPRRARRARSVRPARSTVHRRVRGHAGSSAASRRRTAIAPTATSGRSAVIAEVPRHHDEPAHHPVALEEVLRLAGTRERPRVDGGATALLRPRDHRLQECVTDTDASGGPRRRRAPRRRPGRRGATPGRTPRRHRRSCPRTPPTSPQVVAASSEVSTAARSTSPPRTSTSSIRAAERSRSISAWSAGTDRRGRDDVGSIRPAAARCVPGSFAGRGAPTRRCARPPARRAVEALESRQHLRGGQGVVVGDRQLARVGPRPWSHGRRLRRDGGRATSSLAPSGSTDGAAELPSRQRRRSATWATKRS